MTLMFGNLTLAFVSFGTALQNAFAQGATATAMQEFNDAANTFKRAAADDALYLVCIGKFPLFPSPTVHHLAFATVAISTFSIPARSQSQPLPPNPFSSFSPFSSGVSGRLYEPGYRVLILRFRHWFDCDHLYIHGNMDVHG